MFITNFAIKRPVTIGMIFGLIAILAIIIVPKLPLSLIPNLNLPKLIVSTYWGSSTPEEIEKYITSKVEEAGSTISGIVDVESTSNNGYSNVEFTFDRNTNMGYARFELNEKIQFIQDQLPENSSPRISEFVPSEFSEVSFLEYGVSGPYETWELKEIVEKKFKFKLSSVTGIANVQIMGAQTKEYEIKIHNDKLDKIDFNLLRSTLSSYGKITSTGSFLSQGSRVPLKVDDHFTKIDELNQIRIRRNDGKLVYLHEIASIKEVLSDAYSYRRYNGEPQVVLSIEKDNQANAISLSKEVKAIIEEEKETLPSNIKMNKTSDESENIMKDLNVLFQRGFASLFIIFFVLIIFLRHLQSTSLVLASIFLSTCLTFLLMYLLGVGLNMFSLAGLALGFGMMVDNSIVVYENIFRNQARGLTIKEAALLGTKEVALPIIASTMTTMIVFAPFLYLQGDSVASYIPFVNAMVLSLLSSLFISFTFIPFVCTRFLKFKISQVIEEDEFVFHENLNIYQKVMKQLLRFRWIWIVFIAALVGGSIWLFVKEVDKGFSWFGGGKDDYLRIYVSMPDGCVISQTDHIARQFERILKDEDVKEWNTQVTSKYAFMTVYFEDEIKETSYPLILREKLKAFAVNYGNCNVRITGFGPSFGGGGAVTANFNVNLVGYNYEELKQYAKKLEIFMKKSSRRVQNININAISWYNSKVYEYEMKFDRDALAKYQIPMYYAINQIQLYLKNKQGAFSQTIDNEESDFSIVSNDEDFTIEDLNKMVITNVLNQPILLTQLATIEKVEVMNRISRENQQYTRRINFDYRGSYKKGNKFVEGLINSFKLPIGYKIKKDEGWNSDSDDTNKELIWLLIASIILVYMSLASLFESFKYPFVIILTLPLAFIGVTAMFYFGEETFDSSARIGLILLVGIVVNNSIILVYRINQLRHHGIDRLKSILQASRDRARPILMTSLTTILGLLPMLLKSDVNRSDFWRMLSFSTIGGLTAATIFTLFVTPVLYRLFSKEHEKIENKEVIL